MGNVPFFTSWEPLATFTHNVIEHRVGRERGTKKLRVSMEQIWALVAYGGYII